MPTMSLTPRSSADRLRTARRQWLDSGVLSDDLLAPGLQASWQRSRQHGLLPDGRAPGTPHASAAQLARALAHRRTLVSHAKPVMAFLNEQIRDSDSIVVLADPQGMLLHALGDLGFADRAARVALRPGAIWSEQWRGTNAIGTALADGATVVVHGAEHYLERNAFLTCAAAPIVDPAGQLLGVLDISGDRRAHHRHTLGLVRSGARMIEHQLFESRHAAGLQLRLHAQVEGLGTVTEGLLALSEDGWITGANTAALELLGLPRSAIGTLRLERVLDLDMAALLAAARPGLNGAPRELRRLDGSALWGRLDVGRTVRAGPSALAAPRAVDIAATPVPPRRGAPVSSPMDALAALDRGDGAMQAAIERARRVLDKPIALLLQGESGVGKEVFARATHRSGPRADRPFVAVNCAALPETLIEAELFGYRAGAYTGASRDGAPGRIREAHGGTLFLDEIGDMPLPMQARLLRVLQERQVVPLGGGKPVDVDFRLVCATHRKLRAEVEAGRFREDLYYRVNGLALTLPSLRERGDLDALVEAMLRELEPGRELALSADVAAAFATYRWPGNIRQLVNVLRTACALLGEHEHRIERSHLPEDLIDELVSSTGTSLPALAVEGGGSDLRQQAERCITEALRSSAGNLSEAARRLGISRNTLYRKLRERGG
ncbi:sigma-54-dependent Fis family transcriptional regulator [Leptothrix discophora]|uniref:Sigma-54-dependent Fis family transcriptional regulator n=1 Tax=Leptothrix discophora TaxID=89 RepID=A0ABT9G5B0_LEPDI|nr:sigma-54-dependent Fis family transcriptional regulator [Leptothrix discophora]MDP4301590.1 sigma-54-dependent Fis family transcriptional regulator [Leptothrix discophora]